MTTETLDRPTNALVLKFNASKLLIEELSTELKSLKEKRDAEKAGIELLKYTTPRAGSLSPVDFRSRVEYEKAIQQSIAIDRNRLGLEIDILISKINITIRDINTKTYSLNALKKTHAMLTSRVNMSVRMQK